MVLMRKRRVHLKDTILEICEGDAEVAAKLKKQNRGKCGRPSLETDQPYLHDVIIQLASAGGAADARRRSETIRTCRTLNDLAAALKSYGFDLSRSGLYLR